MSQPQTLLSADDVSRPPAGRVRRRAVFLGWGAGLAAVAALGSSYFVAYRQRFDATVRAQLEAVADLKAAELGTWRRERQGDAALAGNAPGVAERVQSLLERPGDPAAAQWLEQWLDIALIHGGYSLAFVTDSSGAVVLARPNAVLGVTEEFKRSAREAMRSRQITFCDLHLDPKTGAPVMGVVAPVFAGGGGGESIAAMGLLLDPKGSLYPFLQHWPSASDTAETLIVRREGESFVYLSELRHRPSSALTLRQGTSDRNLLARLAEGRADWLEGPDYRGEPVLGVARAVAGQPWWLIAKIDRDEAYAPLRTYRLWLGATTAVLALAVAAGLWAAWRDRTATLLRVQLQQERKENLLAQRIALLTKHANDIILLADAHGTIVDANNRAMEAYERPAEALCGMNLRDLVAPAAREAYEEAVAGNGGRTSVVVETVHRRRAGVSFPVEVSMATFDIEGTSHRQAIVRDLTQRKAYEREISRLSRFYALLSQVNQSVVLSTSREELFNRVCRAATLVGQFPLAWIGWIEDGGRVLRPIARAGVGAGYLDQVTVGASAFGQEWGELAQRIMEGKEVVVNDMATAEITQARRQAAAANGLASCAAFPIRMGGVSKAVYLVYAAEPRMFREKELALLSEVAGDISFALDHLEHEQHRRQTEEALRHSELRFRTLIEQAPDAIFVHAGETFEFVNAAAVRLFGAESAEALVGSPILERVHPSAREAVKRRIAEGQAGRRVPPQERCYLRMDGSPVWVQVAAAPLKTDNGPRAVVFVRDVTESRQARERLADQAALLDRASDAIVVCDLNESVLYWNKGAERLYGWTAQEALGTSIHALLAPDRDVLSAAQREVRARGEWTGEIRNETKSGRKVDALSRWTLMRDETGAAKSIFAIDTDITAKKQLEAQFLRAQRLESVGQLASGIAHDLNNTLTPVLMATALLKAAGGDAETLSALDMIETSAKRGADIVRQILLFSRGDEGEKRPVLLRPLVREIAQIIGQTFPKTIGLVTKGAKDLWLVNGDPTQLHQLLMNLSVNARDAMPNGGTLTLVVENVSVDAELAARFPGARPGPHVLCCVADTGSGIPRQIIDRIFDPFFTTKAKDKGTGLGLSTSLGIVRNHEGFIALESEVGRGTEFRIYLPAIRAAEKNDGSGPAETAPDGRGETVLVVDDEKAIREVVGRLLAQRGYRVLQARDGEDALEIFRKHQADVALVLTDLMMPRMQGGELLRELRAIDTGLKTIAMTGHDELAEAGGERVRADAELRKPLECAALLNVVRTVLDSVRAPG